MSSAWLCLLLSAPQFSIEIEIIQSILGGHLVRIWSKVFGLQGIYHKELRCTVGKRVRPRQAGSSPHTAPLHLGLSCCMFPRARGEAVATPEQIRAASPTIKRISRIPLLSIFCRNSPFSSWLPPEGPQCGFTLYFIVHELDRGTGQHTSPTWRGYPGTSYSERMRNKGRKHAVF